MKNLNYKGNGEHSVNELELIISCPECNSTNLKNAIHTDYKECNKCCHYWEHNAQ